MEAHSKEGDMPNIEIEQYLCGEWVKLANIFTKEGTEKDVLRGLNGQIANEEWSFLVDRHGAVRFQGSAGPVRFIVSKALGEY
jgi:hypothetical protein